MEETLLKLVQFIEETSPQIWAILMRQVYVQATCYGMGSVLSWIAVPVCYKLTKLGIKKTKDTKGYDDDIGWTFLAVFSGIGIATAIGLGIGFGIAGFQRFYNPEFFAIQFLLP